MTVCDDIRTGIKILAVAGATAGVTIAVTQEPVPVRPGRYFGKGTFVEEGTELYWLLTRNQTPSGSYSDATLKEKEKLLAEEGTKLDVSEGRDTPEMPTPEIARLIQTVQPATLIQTTPTQTTYIGANKQETTELDSFMQSLQKHSSTFPPYVEGKQQCIQDAKLAVENWRNDLAASGGNTAWADDAQLLTARDEWHAMVALSPNNKMAFPEKVHVFDPRYASYAGTVRNYGNKDEYMVDIYDISRTKTMEGGSEMPAATGVTPLTELIDPNQERLIQSFVPNSDSYNKAPNDEAEQTYLAQKKSGKVDWIDGNPIPSNEPYYQPKDTPYIKYSVLTVEGKKGVAQTKIDPTTMKNLVKMNPDGTEWKEPTIKRQINETLLNEANKYMWLAPITPHYTNGVV